MHGDSEFGERRFGGDGERREEAEAERRSAGARPPKLLDVEDGEHREEVLLEASRSPPSHPERRGGAPGERCCAGRGRSRPGGGGARPQSVEPGDPLAPGDQAQGRATAEAAGDGGAAAVAAASNREEEEEEEIGVGAEEGGGARPARPRLPEGLPAGAPRGDLGLHRRTRDANTSDERDRRRRLHCGRQQRRAARPIRLPKHRLNRQSANATTVSHQIDFCGSLKKIIWQAPVNVYIE